MNEEQMEIIVCENGPFMVNTYMVYDEKTMKGFMIDPGSDIDPLLKHCDDNKIAIEAIIATHTHIDHIAGVKNVQTRYGIPFYCSEKEKEFIKNVAIQARMFGVKDPGQPVVDTLLGDSGTITLSGFEIALLHTPGHSPGSLSLYNRANSIVFSGDALFSMSIGRTDLPGGNYQELIQSIEEKLFTLPDETTVYPGHGPATTIGTEKQTNPFFG
jgi:hydroxyacylglutathione hydrolase